MINILFIIASLSLVYSQTVVDIVTGNSDLSSLATALTNAGLVDTLNGAGPFTVFAPTNAAFTAVSPLPSNDTVVSNILQYHVLSQNVPSSALTSGLIATTLIGQTITCQLDLPNVYFYDSMGRRAQVTTADQTATNGVVHIIDMVFLPDGTLADIANNVASLSSLNGALKATGLNDTLATVPATFTVFAPTDAAVAAFTGTIDDQILLYHVLTTKYASGDIPSGSTMLPTANTNMDQVTVINNGTGVFVQDARDRVAQVTVANIQGVNGVAHVIDLVLDTPSVVDLVLSRSDLTTLATALTDAGLISTLSDKSSEFTVFAPTNDAFAAIGTLPTGTALENILKYHVVSGTILSSSLVSGLVATTLITQTITFQKESGNFYFYDSMGRRSQVTTPDLTSVNSATVNGVIHIIDTVLLPDGTLADIFNNIASLSTLNGALKATGLNTTLAAAGTYTVFAPTNDAVSAFVGTIDDQVLLYHVLTTKYLSTEIPDGSTELTTANTAMDKLTVINNGTGIFVQDAADRVAQVTMANYQATNGVVHIIDMVLMEAAPSVVDVVLSRSDLTTLAGALTDAGLISTLDDTSSSFTVFAPTNDAFTAIGTLPTGTALENILKYHVVSGTVLSSALVSGLVAETLITQTITFQKEGGNFYFYDSMGRRSQVTTPDLATINGASVNGVIHIIDTVLLPDGTLADITKNIASLSTLNGALESTGLNATLAAAGTYTLFAPTNDAVAAFTGTIDDQLLLYHVLGTKYLSGAIPDGSTELTTANTAGDKLTVIKNGTGVFVQDAVNRVAQVTMANFQGTNGVAHIIDLVLSPIALPTTSMPTSSPVTEAPESSANKIFVFSLFSILCALFF